ncbi:hypothetical protein Bca101_047730 [Brassica carinata]
MRLVSGGTEFRLEAPLRRRLEAGSSVDACLLLSLVRARGLNKWRFLLQSAILVSWAFLGFVMFTCSPSLWA